MASTVSTQLQDLLGARVEREVYLSTAQAAELTGKPSREAFIKWDRHEILGQEQP